MRHTTGLTASVVLWCVALVTGCTSSEPISVESSTTSGPVTTLASESVATETTTIDTTTTTTAATTSVLAPPSSTSHAVQEPALVDDVQIWTTVLGPSPDLAPKSRFNGSWFVSANEMSTMSAGANGGDLQVIYEAPGREWLIEGPALSGDWLAFAEWEPNDGDYRLWVHNLATGSRELVEEWGGTPAMHNIPQLSLDNDWLVWSTNTDESTVCIRARDLVAGETREVTCAEMSDTVLWQPKLNWPYLTYRAQHVTPVCLSLLTIVLPDGVPLPASHKECWGYDGAQDDHIRIWTEFEPDSGKVTGAPLYAEDSEGVVWSLGPVSVGSTELCDGRAFWKVELQSHTEIRTWTPSEPVRVIYRSTLATYPTTLPWCMDGWVSFMFADGDAAPLTREVVALSVGSLDSD